MNASECLFDGLQISDNLRDFRVAHRRLRNGRHIADRMSDQIERLLVAPVEWNERRSLAATSLGAMAPPAIAVVQPLAGVVDGSSHRARADGHHEDQTAENH